MKKRKNVPGYIEKVNARGHKYWAKDPNYVDKKVPEESLQTKPVEGHVLTYEQAEDEIMGAMDMFTSEDAKMLMYKWDFDFSKDGWEFLMEEYNDGFPTQYIKGPSGQVYQMESEGWSEWSSVTEYGVDISPVKDASYDIDAVTVFPSPVSYIEPQGEEHKEFISLVEKSLKENPYLYDYDMTIVPELAKFKVKELPGGDYDGAPIPGYKGIQGWDNGSEGNDRVYTKFHSFTLDGQEYIIMYEVASEAAYVENSLEVKNGSLFGEFYVVDQDTPKEKMHIQEYHYDHNAPKVNIPVKGDDNFFSKRR